MAGFDPSIEASDAVRIEVESSNHSVLEVIDGRDTVTLIKHAPGPVALQIIGKSGGRTVAVTYHMDLAGPDPTDTPALPVAFAWALGLALSAMGARRLRRR